MKFKNSIKRTSEGNIILINTNDTPHAPIGIRRPPPFSLSLRLEDWVVINCMIDTRAISTIIPKVIVDKMKLYIIWYIDGVIKLDSSLMDMIESVKGFTITINMFSNISIILDSIIVDLTPLFGICLSREFTTKLGGYLDLDYTHLPLPFQNKYVKILNYGTKSIHLRKLS